MMFRRQDRERIANGEITLTFRLWKTPKVKAGKRYATGFGTIEVEDVTVIPAALVARKDVQPSGLGSISAIWESAGEHTKTRVVPGTLLHRVQFRFLGDVPASSTRAAEVDLDRLAERLTRWIGSRRAGRGRWPFSG